MNDYDKQYRAMHPAQAQQFHADDQKPSTPAPLSADSLREQLRYIFGNTDTMLTTFERVDQAVELYAAALQAERQRIADSLPEKQLNEWSIINPTDKQRQKHWRIGWNDAIEAVRAVLIPPLGGLETPRTASASGNQVDTPVEPI